MGTNKKNEPEIDLENYLEKPYWVVDFLPRQVPPNSRGQYFVIEDYFLSHPQIDDLNKKFFHILLKLNCYDDMDVSLNGAIWDTNPAPQEFKTMMTSCIQEKSMLHALLRSSDTLLTISGDDTHLTVYHPTKEVLDLLHSLASAEGLHLWKP